MKWSKTGRFSSTVLYLGYGVDPKDGLFMRLRRREKILPVLIDHIIFRFFGLRTPFFASAVKPDKPNLVLKNWQHSRKCSLFGTKEDVVPILCL